jgi:hypothetical protein
VESVSTAAAGSDTAPVSDSTSGSMAAVDVTDETSGIRTAKSISVADT